jgi:hypothetical protein
VNKHEVEQGPCNAVTNHGAIQRLSRSRQNNSSLRASLIAMAVVFMFVLSASPVAGQVNGQGHAPYLGWNSWSQEVVKGQAWLTEAGIEAQSDALKSSGLQAHGYVYINIDSGWMSGFDQYGRPAVNTAKFPDGMAATIQHIHNNGQKAGIYWIPGIQQPDYDANPPILGTAYTLDSIVLPNTPGNAFSFGQSDPWHKKIDFTRPGAQAYITSVVDLFESWGVDLIKLDGVTPGSDHNNLLIDNRDDVVAWSLANSQSGRPIWLTVSWALGHSYVSTWQAYANARRIEDDVDCRCGTLTNWTTVSRRFGDLVTWQGNAGPTDGWNDLDSLEVGNGSQDGLTDDERQSAMSLWAIANAPLYTGDDLTQLDSFGLQLLTNDAVIAVDQSGVPGSQIHGGSTPVWASSLGSGVYYLALFNLGSESSVSTVNWSALGFSGWAAVHDLWTNSDLGAFNGTYNTVLNSHASQLLKVTVLDSRLTTPTITLTAAPATSVVGSAVTITATVASQSGMPSGMVAFYSGSISLGPGRLNSGIASLTTRALTVGLDSITAVYQGDNSFSPVTSDPLVVTVDPAFAITATPTSLTLSSSSKEPVSLLTVVPGGNSNTLSFACANLPSAITCSFSPSTLALAGVSSPQTVAMTVKAPSLIAELSRSHGKSLPILGLCGLFIAFPLSLGLLLPLLRHNSSARLLTLLVIGCAAASVCGCGSSSTSDSSSSPVSPTTYNFVVNVSSGTALIQTLQYSITVQ